MFNLKTYRSSIIFTNIQEKSQGTDPNNADTDSDGLKDGDEVQRGTNPLQVDSDGDDMNITWLSNSSGSWQTFGTNLSGSDGT